MYLRSNIGQEVIKSILRKTVMTVINQEDLKKIPVPVFNKEKRKKLIMEYREYKRQCKELNEKIKKTEKDLSDKLCGKISIS